MMSDSQHNISPLVTVVMAAYNAEGTITEAVQSILDQDFRDFELLVINDGSTDKTLSILSDMSHQDSRIRLITQTNMGLTRSLNRGLMEAKGKYIARQDADDYSYPSRLAEQVALLEANTDIVLCGANCDNAFPNGLISAWGHRSEAALKKSIPFKTPFAHSTAFFRKDAALALGGYDESYLTAQDMEFWIRLSQCGRVVMLETPLIKRNILGTSVSIKKRWRQTYDAFRARWTHNDNKPKALYHTARSLIISLLPDRIIAAKQRKK